MNLKKLILKFTVLLMGLAVLHITSKPASATNFQCPTGPIFCSTNTSAGHCGYEPGETCGLCYGRDGSTLASDSCPGFN